MPLGLALNFRANAVFAEIELPAICQVLGRYSDAARDIPEASDA